MTIQGSSLSMSMYTSNYLSSAKLNVQDNEQLQQGVQGGKGPGGPGGPGGARPPKDPDLDTDADGVWSESEINDFATQIGSSLDASSIISTYDTDGDGVINASERESLAQDNALNLPPPHEMTQMKQEFSEMQNTQTEGSISSDLINQMIQSYLSNNENENQLTSFFDMAL